jgi:hypothetical protein
MIKAVERGISETPEMEMKKQPEARKQYVQRFWNKQNNE